MVQPRHLDNAPITEALVDFRVKARPGFDPRDFVILRDQLRDRFPTSMERTAFEAVVELQGDTPSSSSRSLGLDGFVFQSSDSLEVAQFRTDGFTFNRLAPYTSWIDIRPKALGLWQRYVSIAQPEAVTRLALRYINHMRLEASPRRLDRFLTTPPQLPPELGVRIDRFLTRFGCVNEPSGFSANVAIAMDPSIQEGDAVLLDIDVYHTAEFPVQDPQLEITLDALDEFKNRIFFSSITEEAVSLFV